MNPPEQPTRVVLTIRSEREHLVLYTTDGPVAIHLQPRNKSRSQVIVEAPRKVGVRREANPEVVNEQ